MTTALTSLRAGLLAALMIVASGADAQQASREQEQLRRLRAQAQQLQQALSAEQQARQQADAEAARLKQAAEIELPKLEEEAAAARRRAGGMQKRADQLARDLEEAQQARDALTRQLDDTRRQLEARERELAQTRGTLQTTERDLGTTRGQADALTGRLAQCRKDNLELYRTGIEVLDRWRDRTLGEQVAQGEPFTQVGRVKLENLAETYRDRLEQHVVPAKP
jgi:chromosome segregation ATPase